MAKQLLSDRRCASAKPKTKVYYYNDGNGLRLQVRPNGARYRMLRYRISKPNGTQRETTHGLGSYPEVSLADARRVRAAL
jgi:hypothetical protein